MPQPIERVGIIGAGGAAAMHLHALRRTAGVRVVGILDLHPDRAAALASSFGLPTEVADPARFYSVAQPQSVHIVTPPDAHEELAREALNHGMHVLIEKPPAMTNAGCAALVKEAAERKLTIGVNENTASDPLIRRARCLIQAGQLGRVLHIDGFYSFAMQADQRPSPWMLGLPGGMLEDLLPHLITTARALAGVPLEVDHCHLATTGQVAGELQDELRLLLTGRDGLTVTLALSLCAHPRAFALVVRGAAATLTVDLRNMVLQFSRPASRGGALGTGLAFAGSTISTLCQTASNAVGLLAGRREGPGSFLPLIRSHYAALSAGTELPAPLSRAMDTVRLIRTIWPLPEPVQIGAEVPTPEDAGSRIRGFR